MSPTHEDLFFPVPKSIRPLLVHLRNPGAPFRFGGIGRPEASGCFHLPGTLQVRKLFCDRVPVLLVFLGAIFLSCDKEDGFPSRCAVLSVFRRNLETTVRKPFITCGRPGH